MVTLIANANTASLGATGAAIAETAVTAFATASAIAGTFVSTPVLVPVATTVAVGTAGAYFISQIVNKDNHSQNAN
ncbi:MAG: hypothetical protein ACKO11_12705 [Cuspidothrix sp.]